MNGHALRIQTQRYGPRFTELEAVWSKSEWWSAERIRSFQNEKLRDIVRYAHSNIPFYRQRFKDAGVLPEDIGGVGDLSRLPILTKDEVREAGDSIIAVGKGSKLVHGHTSGTTGSPLSLFYDRTMCIVNNVADWRQKSWGRMKKSNWCGMFLGRVVVPTGQATAPFWRTNYLHKQVWFSTFHMSDENLGIYVNEIRKRNLQFLEGYPSTLFILANFLERRGDKLPLKGVFTSSETLHSVQRSTLQGAFDCPIFDFYGLAERVLFAGECEFHSGKHVFDEYGILEITDDSGNAVPDGQTGWITATTLWNRGMPLIRYRTSDLSSKLLGPCRCGRNLTRISDVTTKAEDVVVTPDGRYLSPSVLTHPFKPFPQLVKSQIIQDSVNKITVKIVPSKEFSQQHQEKLLAGLQERLGSLVTIDIQTVTDIPVGRSGKFRWVISKVPHSCKVGWESQGRRSASTPAPVTPSS